MADIKIINMSPGTYVAGNYLCMVNGSNAPYKIPLSQFASASQAVPSWLTLIDGGGNVYMYAPANSVFYIGFSSGMYLYMRGPSAASPHNMGFYGPDGSIMQGRAAGVAFAGGAIAGGYGLTLPNDSNKKAKAYSWDIYPSSLALKSEVVEITEPLPILRPVKGITYKQDGRDRVGISAEDLEATGLPEAVSKDENGNYTSINPMVLIPLLVQAVKKLETTIINMEARILALEKK